MQNTGLPSCKHWLATTSRSTSPCGDHPHRSMRTPQALTRSMCGPLDVSLTVTPEGKIVNWKLGARERVDFPGGCGLYRAGSHLHQRRVKWAGLGKNDTPGENHAAMGLDCNHVVTVWALSDLPT